MKLVGLGRQIALSMMAIALGVALLVILGSYLFYFLWKTYWPNHFPIKETWVPSSIEWIWMIGTTLTGIALAVIVAINLSKRILLPLNSVVDGIRRVSQGDLNARAIIGDPVLGEASTLACDFNNLASKLQTMTEEQRFWNAAIAHELRTPVTILRGRIQGLAEGIFTPDERQFRSLLDQVEGLARLIEDLRAVSLAESGHLKLEMLSIDLSDELKSVIDIAEPGLNKAGHKILVDFFTGPVLCDPLRMRQLLLALLENVRKHADPGIIKISTNIEGGFYFLRVEDSGPGISEDLLPYVFTAFRRASHSSGNGLGLAVVSAIALAHEGEANCRITKNGGTLFEIKWPHYHQ